MLGYFTCSELGCCDGVSVGEIRKAGGNGGTHLQSQHGEGVYRTNLVYRASSGIAELHRATLSLKEGKEDKDGVRVLA